MPRSHRRAVDTDNRAAQYVRMSTDHQQYSIDNQIDAIREYADAHGLKVVRTYSDPGKSGLTIKHRPGLQRLLDDVAAGDAPFRRLLVYDVSRWGRFQEPDEGAAYEHHCRVNGVEVIYCVESFDNTGGAMNSLLKHMKRSMAAEYSRDLSLRVARAKTRMARLGYWQGGPAPYGYRRCAVSHNGRREKLELGEQRFALSWRTTLMLGPPEEVALIRRIFLLFVKHNRNPFEIARTLTAEGWPTRRGGPWSALTIRHIVRSEVYAGTMTFNQTSHGMLRDPVTNDRADWVVVEDAFPAIVSKEIVSRAQERFTRGRPAAYGSTDAELLNQLRALYRQHGRLSSKIVRASTSLPTPDCYRKRFGSLGMAFGLVGFRPNHFERTLAYRRRIRSLQTDLAGELRLRLAEAGFDTVSQSPNRFRLFQDVIVTVAVGPARRGRPGENWDLRFPTEPFTKAIVARLSEDRETILDYQIMHRADFPGVSVCVGPTARSAKLAPGRSSVDEVFAALVRGRARGSRRMDRSAPCSEA